MRDHMDAQEATGAGPLTANGKPRASRAAQFMPFAALTGYYELARQQERITEPRHELTIPGGQFDALFAADVIISDYSTVIYEAGLLGIPVYLYAYDWDTYRTVSGIVARIDFAFRRIQVVKTVIGFDDILAIKR